MISDFETTFILPLEAACRAAMQYVQTRGGGLYGGVYVVRLSDAPYFDFLSHDDPERLTDNQDVFAQVTKDKVYSIGHARNYLQTDGTVDRHYFERD